MRMNYCLCCPFCDRWSQCHRAFSLFVLDDLIMLRITYAIYLLIVTPCHESWIIKQIGGLRSYFRWNKDFMVSIVLKIYCSDYLLKGIKFRSRNISIEVDFISPSKRLLLHPCLYETLVVLYLTPSMCSLCRFFVYKSETCFVFNLGFF